MVGQVAARPVHVADRAQQDIGQGLVQRLDAVQQLVRHCEEQPSLAAKAHSQACTRMSTHHGIRFTGASGASQQRAALPCSQGSRAIPTSYAGLSPAVTLGPTHICSMGVCHKPLMAVQEQWVTPL